MAVEQMSFVTLIGPMEQFDSIIGRAFRRYSFQPEDAVSVLKEVKGLYSFTSPNPYESLLKKCGDVLDVAQIPRGYRDFTGLTFEPGEIEDLCDQVRQMMEEKLEQRSKLLAQKEEQQRLILQLHPLEGVELSFDTLLNFEYVKFRFGRLPIDSYEKYKLYLDESKYAIYVPAFQEDGFIWGIYFVPRQHKESIDSLFLSLHFERQRLDGRLHGTPAQAMKQLEEDNIQLSRQIEALDIELVQLTEQYREPLLLRYSAVKYQHDIFDIRNKCAHSRRNFYLTGWLPSRDLDGFVSQFDNDPLVNCITEEAHEVAKRTTPPTKLRNFWLFRPFESFVEMYSLPSYGEFDPTPLMAISYVLLFGVMFGDLGQGLCLAALGILLRWWKKIPLATILIYVGLSSAVFGGLYGSVFGLEELIPGFHPMEHINTLLVASIALGAGMITLVMLLNIFNALRRKDVGKALFDANGISGIVFYWGAIFAILGVMGLLPNVASLLYIVVVLLVPLLLIYLKEPLSKLLQRRKDWKPEKPGEFFMENFFEMFEVLLSYVSNSVSFIRVGAFALNHAGMMLAVRVIAELAGGGSPVVMILGNIFVMCMEGLIVGIQVLRLEFYELFSRFFQGGGRAFEPFQIKYDKK